MKDNRITNIHSLSSLLLTAVHGKIADGVPYCIWGHSVGTWVAFEFMMLCRRIGLPAPKAAFLNAFPAPHTPAEKRPWHRSRKLDDKGLREELLMWDRVHFEGAGSIVYREEQWKPMFEPIMRADFCLFDEYRFKHDGAPPFDFPLHCWHMDMEHYNTPDLIEAWKDWTTAKFDFRRMPDMGHLTCFYKPELKTKFFQEVTEHLKGYYA